MVGLETERSSFRSHWRQTRRMLRLSVHFYSPTRLFFLALTIAALTSSACATSDNPALDEACAETGLCEQLLEPVPEGERAAGDGKTDLDGERGPRVAAGVSSEVWGVTRDWDDIESAPGLAWGADSGLDWEEKYDLWIGSMERIPNHSGYGESFRITTPHGNRAFDAPTLECAEVALLLRTMFASWHGLPFFMQGWDSNSRQTLFAGHFGFINSSGGIVGRFPAFRERYRDYRGSWEPGDAWPSDPVLRSYRLGQDDAVPSLGGLGAGAYFDEIFLNKRVGYFARLLLLYFGSVNLVDEANMFHIQPEATRAGDVLLKRWQRRGIGHVMPVMRHRIPVEGRLELSIASGSMPRKQPLWEAPASARGSFTADTTGGPGESWDDDGATFAELGGGIRRWRTAVLVGGRWRNYVREADEEFYISNTDFDAIGARPGRFEEILTSVSADDQLVVALQQIEAQRRHLRMYPASCAARTRREDAFQTLYEIENDNFGRTPAEVDADYRMLEDYVFAELEYESSRTCCWNSSTAAMAEIILDFAEEEQAEALVSGMCVQPTVFRAESEGFERWLQHARTLGRSAEWVEWSEDEPCAQRDVPEDSIAEDRGLGGYCETVEPEPEPEPEPPSGESCEHSNGGVYIDRGCSGSYQCCDGLWRSGAGSCGECACVETTGREGCGIDDEPSEPPVPVGDSCGHSLGGTFAHTACSPSYQCCDGTWKRGHDHCGVCLCVEETGRVGCSG